LEKKKNMTTKHGQAGLGSLNDGQHRAAVEPSVNEDADIVGGGGGVLDCAIAWRLAAVERREVLLLSSGTNWGAAQAAAPLVSSCHSSLIRQRPGSSSRRSVCWTSGQIANFVVWDHCMSRRAPRAVAKSTILRHARTSRV
jgi:choline dehydrogenase-like flavoprotein